MKTRKEVAEYINSGKLVKKGELEVKPDKWHFGLVDIRNLMDFIYDDVSPKKDELIIKID